MEAVIDRRLFAEETKWVSSSLSAKPANTIHHSVLLTAAGDTLTVSGSDGEVSSETTLQAKVVQDGGAVVPRKLLATIADLLPKADDVHLTLEGSRLLISGGRAQFKVPTVPVATYPSLLGQPDYIGSVSSEALAEAVSQVGSAAATDEITPVLTSVLLRFGADKELLLVATNKYRLGLKRIAWEPTGDDVREAKVPRRWLDRALSNPPPGQIHISLSADDSVFGLTVGHRRSVLPVFEGAFPDYNRLLGLQFFTTVEFDTKEFAEALGRLHLVASKPEISVRAVFDEEEVVLTAGDADTEASEAVACQTTGRGMDGEPVLFNPEYLMQAIRTLRGEVGRMLLDTPPRPVRLYSAEDEEHIQLVVPVRR